MKTKLFIAALLNGLMSSSMCATVAAEPSSRIAYEDPFTGFKFPQTIGSYKFQGRIQYDRVRLGYGINYLDTTGARCSIVIYDMDLTDIQDGIADPRVVEEFNKIEEGIAGMAKQGAYRGFKRNDALPQLSKAWLQINHELIDARGQPMHAYSFIRGQHRKFVKIRITTASKGTYARLPLFLLEVSRAVGMLGASSAFVPNQTRAPLQNSFVAGNPIPFDSLRLVGPEP